MSQKILFVDDEPNILEAFKRQLRKDFDIDIAMGAKPALEKIEEQKEPYAVIVSDLRMPEMDGIRLLSEIRKEHPDTVRMMLTGNADLESAIHAVNEGHIFRFLVKPCPTEILKKAITLGIEQYRLVTAEKELLEKTLKGSIQMLTEILSLLNPKAFARSGRVKKYMEDMAAYLKAPNSWELETAAMLSQIGWVMLSEETLTKLYNGKTLDGEELQVFEMAPMIAYDLISHIPRMKGVADIIAYQGKHFDGKGNPKDTRQGNDIPLGARLMKVLLDFEMLETNGVNQEKAILELRKRKGWYDPAFLIAFEEMLRGPRKYEQQSIFIEELKDKMIIVEDIMTLKGQLLVPKGQQVNLVTIERLKNFKNNIGIKEPITVYTQTDKNNN